ncbi:hypothetical protein EVAR_3921_1 [Eumeta japonica]|uniref:Uncharacterized protein n=1 Tax=Eumeta variegata TaxID=151549 RepID=A0A4C1SRM6_EUMVA|nr:hypothetical protein EVAR_3921_1 [Eumeta japonica]
MTNVRPNPRRRRIWTSTILRIGGVSSPLHPRPSRTPEDVYVSVNVPTTSVRSNTEKKLRDKPLRILSRPHPAVAQVPLYLYGFSSTQGTDIAHSLLHSGRLFASQANDAERQRKPTLSAALCLCQWKKRLAEVPALGFVGGCKTLVGTENRSLLPALMR